LRGSIAKFEYVDNGTLIQHWRFQRQNQYCRTIGQIQKREFKFSSLNGESRIGSIQRQIFASAFPQLFPGGQRSVEMHLKFLLRAGTKDVILQDAGLSRDPVAAHSFQQLHHQASNSLPQGGL
jgi:hypothetical protein